MNYERGSFRRGGGLKGKNNNRYGPLPIPQPRDGEITEVLRAWMALDEPTRQVAAQRILEEQRNTLLAYSERMASLAVRERAEEWIFLGLVALGVDGWRGEWRENVLVICLHYDAAQRLRVSPESVFEKAATLLPLRSANALRAFLRRSEADKTLKAMGYVVGADADGLRYIRTW